MAEADKSEIVDGLVPELLLNLDNLTKADKDMMHWATRFDYVEGVAKPTAPTRKRTKTTVE